MLVWDLESDGLLDTVTKIHCITIYDPKADTVHLFDPSTPRPIEDGIKMLMEADGILGHNIIGYDVPCLKLLYPWFKPKGKIIDTLVISRVAHPDIKSTDYGRYRAGKLPGKLIGSYSLKAWGYRLGEYKGAYGEKENAWETWTPEMSQYCIQDVKVTFKLWERLSLNPVAQEALDLEHQVATIISQQERNGFLFDIPAAERLTAELAVRRTELKEQLQRTFTPWYQAKGRTFIPKKDNKKMRYVAGCAIVGRVERIVVVLYN